MLHVKRTGSVRRGERRRRLPAASSSGDFGACGTRPGAPRPSPPRAACSTMPVHASAPMVSSSSALPPSPSSIGSSSTSMTSELARPWYGTGARLPPSMLPSTSSAPAARLMGCRPFGCCPSGMSASERCPSRMTKPSPCSATRAKRPPAPSGPGALIHHTPPGSSAEGFRKRGSTPSLPEAVARMVRAPRRSWARGRRAVGSAGLAVAKQ
mmetsp:Transcript_34870/g.87849  ORF Transcript_34870/g.87849 Transcript_34870/m.87849 type:complete len:211 (-) Transcript_34870:269-901(-)